MHEQSRFSNPGETPITAVGGSCNINSRVLKSPDSANPVPVVVCDRSRKTRIVRGKVLDRR
jgi:hypothetical protein